MLNLYYESFISIFSMHAKPFRRGEKKRDLKVSLLFSLAPCVPHYEKSEVRILRNIYLNINWKANKSSLRIYIRIVVLLYFVSSSG